MVLLPVTVDPPVFTLPNAWYHCARADERRHADTGERVGAVATGATYTHRCKGAAGRTTQAGCIQTPGIRGNRCRGNVTRKTAVGVSNQDVRANRQAKAVRKGDADI